MKRKSILTIKALALAAALLVLIWLGFNHGTVPTDSPDKGTTQQVSKVGRAEGSGKKKRWEPSPEETEAWQSTEAVLYGKIIDLDGIPVSQAEVECSIRHYPGAQNENERKFILRPEADGTFYTKQQRAPVMEVSVSAVGYYPTEKSRKSFDFSNPPRSMPDEILRKIAPKDVTTKEKPTLFILRKMKSREPLVARDLLKVLTSSQTYLVGLNSEHSIRFDYWFDPTATGTNHYGQPTNAWGIEIFVDGGGIKQTEKAVAEAPESFIAPSDGYSPSLRFAFDGSVATYKRLLKASFFVMFNDGKYARLETTFDSDTKRPTADIDSWFNPSGSRSTEFDPALQIEVPPAQR